MEGGGGGGGGKSGGIGGCRECNRDPAAASDEEDSEDGGEEDEIGDEDCIMRADADAGTKREDPDADVKALFTETKRCVLYIIRVQAGINLLDILVKPVTLEDEDKWMDLVRDELSASSTERGAYAEAMAPPVLTQVIASMASIMGVVIPQEKPTPTRSLLRSSDSLSAQVIEYEAYPGRAPSGALPVWMPTPRSMCDGFAKVSPTDGARGGPSPQTQDAIATVYCARARPYSSGLHGHFCTSRPNPGYWPETASLEP